MATAREIGRVEFFAPLPEWALEMLAARAQERTYAAGDFIARQHEKATFAHVLTSGEVQVLLRFEGTGDLVTETLTEANPMIGWSVFRPPYRYTASIRCQSPCTALAIPREAFDAVFEVEPALEVSLLRQAAAVVADRLESTVTVLVGDESTEFPNGGGLRHPQNASQPPTVDSVSEHDFDVLLEAPFFEHFSQTELAALAQQARVEIHPAGSVILAHGGVATALHMLVAGRARLIYGDQSDLGDPPAAFSWQTIAEPGRVLGWSALVAPFRYRAGAIAVRYCRTMVFDHDTLVAFADEHPGFGVRLMRQVLQLLGSRLRESRMRLIARRYDDEVLAIRALIDQHAEELSVTSPLHKLPVFLENRVTMPDAITAMRLLEVHGDQNERTLAASCLDMMDNISTELEIYQRLQTIYQHVAGASENIDPTELRRSCCEEFRDLFALTHYVIEGARWLPEEPGHIVVMNHLTNDESNRLPNGFRLTLDTHFVSSMILFAKYGQAPIRVIRKSSPDEYAHQMYYDRLGYIYVYRADVDPIEIAEGAAAEERRAAFLRMGQDQLARSQNIVICPEGDCTGTGNSPLPFKTGAFRLAAFTEPGPLVIPISVANFDKRLTRTTLAAIVHEPFRLSDHLGADATDAELRSWVNGYQTIFADYVRDTIALAEAEGARPRGSGPLAQRLN